MPQANGLPTRDEVMRAKFYPNAMAMALALGETGTYGDSYDIIDTFFWDSNLFTPTASADMVFFQQNQGNAYGSVGGNQKTLTETNMNQAGQLPKGYTFVADEISFALISALTGAEAESNLIVNAWINYLQNTTTTFKVAARDFEAQIPGDYFFPPVFTGGLASAANATRVGDMLNAGLFKMNIPIPLDSGVNWSVRLGAQSGVAAITTVLNAASALLNTQSSQVKCRVRGVLIRNK